MEKRIKMAKKQQKWIALLVVCTFMWLMQAGTMPAAATGTTEQVGSAGTEPGPDYLEAVGQKAAPARKKSILPYVLIGVGVVAVTAVVLSLALKSSYDIIGTWNFTFTYGVTNSTFAITFAGDKKSGGFSCPDNPTLSGSYAVDGKKVTLVLTPLPSVPFSGQFSDKNTMHGTMTEGAISYTWTAVRQ
jgi:hypothetical protein